MPRHFQVAFSLDPSLPSTAREQVEEQLVNSIHLGALKPGDRLPSVRQLAQQLRVNSKTAFEIYRYLAQRGTVEVRHKSGVYVKFSGPQADKTHADSVQRFVTRVRRRAEQFNLSPRRLARLLCHDQDDARLRVAVLECNREQVELFSRELELELGVRTIPLVLGGSDAGLLKELGSADLLVTTDFHWQDVRRLALRARREALRIRLNPAFLKMVIANARKGVFPMVVPETSYEPRFRSALALLAPASVAERVLLVDCRDRKRLEELWTGVERAYVSPLCLAQIRAQVPKEVELLTVEHMIARQSLQELRRKLA